MIFYACYFKKCGKIVKMDMYLLRVDRYSDKKMITLKGFCRFCDTFGFFVNCFHDVKCF